MLPMKNALRAAFGAVLLLVALPILPAESFVLGGLVYPMPSLLRFVALILAGQIAVLAAGYLARPSVGKIGFVRAAAFIFYFIQSLPLPTPIFALLYWRFAHVALFDSDQAVWLTVASSSGLGLLFFSARAWNLSLGFARKTRA
jgi:hypothetical protein